MKFTYSHRVIESDKSCINCSNNRLCYLRKDIEQKLKSWEGLSGDHQFFQVKESLELVAHFCSYYSRE